MAREHLYRAKRKDNGEWVYGYYVKANSVIDCEVKHYIFEQPVDYYGYNEFVCNYEVDEKTICQYTGLKDKNGTKVFEGDLIRFSHPAFKKSVICEVIYTEEEARFDLLCLFNTDFAVFCEDCKFGEVVGNKFDNPELLEVQDEIL